MSATPQKAAASGETKSIGLVAAISIGIGGLIGAGVFAILGVVAGIVGSVLPVSFAIGGVVAVFAAYSYVKLGKTFPSIGGSVTFLVQGYGDSVTAGTLNVFQYFAYIISLAIYATGFAAYAITFVDLPTEVFGVGIILAFTLVNFVGSRLMGRAESVIVIIKVSILIVFIIAAFTLLDSDTAARLDPSEWSTPLKILIGAGVIFVGFEGFGLILNAAANMKDPDKEIPRAVFGAVGITIAIYVLVAIGVILSLPLPQVESLGNDALSVAAKPSMGEFGFKLVAVAAILSTASAVNATLFGSANVAFQIAKNGGLPPAFDRKLWGRDVEGLFITAAITIVFILIFPLSAVASMGSAGFLIVYAAVHYGHIKLRDKTGAKLWILVTAIILSLVLLAALLYYMVTEQQSSAIALVITMGLSFLFELYYRRHHKRDFKQVLAQTSIEGKPAAAGSSGDGGSSAPAPPSSSG
ncbi:MAG: APC family permease [Solirubrobacterales bacterium]